jgi:hypothetical protein
MIRLGACNKGSFLGYLQAPVVEWSPKDVGTWAKSIDMPKNICKQFKYIDGKVRWLLKLMFFPKSRLANILSCIVLFHCFPGKDCVQQIRS